MLPEARQREVQNLDAKLYSTDGPVLTELNDCFENATVDVVSETVP